MRSAGLIVAKTVKIANISPMSPQVMDSLKANVGAKPIIQEKGKVRWDPRLHLATSARNQSSRQDIGMSGSWPSHARLESPNWMYEMK